MRFTMIKVNDHYVVRENERQVFTIEYKKEHKLLTIMLKNMYGDEIFGIYQVKKWYNSIMPEMLSAFAIYEHDEKLGAIYKKHECFEILYHDVVYRLYSGKHSAKRTAICFDRHEQIAEFIIDEESSVKFKNGSLGVLYSFLMVLMKEFVPQEKFSETAFLHHYIGLYKDEQDI